MTRRMVFLGLVLACAFSFLLNAENIPRFFHGGLSVAELGGYGGSADEVYYFALIREVADGYPHMGNSSLLEHREAPSLTGYALLPQGLVAAMGMDVAHVVLLGDILFPAVIAFLLLLIAVCLFGRLPEALLFTAAFLLRWNVGLLRTMNPQITMSVFFFWLLLFVMDRETRRPLLRGVALTILVLVQPICAALAFALEGFDLLLTWRRGTRLHHIVRDRLFLFLIPVVAALLQSAWVAAKTDVGVLADLSARRGLTLSHLPSDPITTFLLILLGLVWFFRHRRARSVDPVEPLMILFAAAGVAVLNQQVIHGHEAIFGLYYRTPLSLFLGFMIALLLQRLLRRRFFLGLLCCALLFYGWTGVATVHTVWAEQTAAGEELRASGIPEALAKLSILPGERVVFAPIGVSNLVPVLTTEYTLFTQYAHFEYVSDRELAERYLLQRAFFPLPEIQTVEGDPLVFGLAAGNRYARAKTYCRILAFTGFPHHDCSAFRLPDFITHQDLRTLVDRRTVDAQKLLEQYRVDTIVSDTPLPPALLNHCHQSASAGAYTIYECRFTDS